MNLLYAYDEHNGNSYTVLVNQALYFKNKNMELFLTFQERVGGTEVHNCPNQFDPNSPFYITFLNQDLSIPLLLKVTMCYLSLLTLTEEGVHTLSRVNLKSTDGIWDPSTRKYEANKPDPSDLDQT